MVAAATPRTRNAASVWATRSAGSGPSGRYQVTVQLSAPSMPRATSAGSVSTNSREDDAAGDESPERALVAIALGDDARAQDGGERVHLQVGRGALDFVQENAQVRRQHVPQPVRGARRGLARGGDGREHAVERAVLAVEEDLVLAAEVVIEVRGRQVGGARDVAHARVGEAALPEHAGGGPQDQVPAVGLSLGRTAVRISNHGSIIAAYGLRLTEGAGKP